MSTLGTMIDRIAGDLKKGTAFNTPIQEAILSAVADYQDQDFWFLEGKQTQTTTANTATVALDTQHIKVDSLTITVSSNEYPLILRPFSWYREVQTNPSTVPGIPTDYAVHQELYYLYPTPADAYTITWYGQLILTTLSATTDTNAWMTDAERLIRSRAMYYVIANELQDPDRASMWGGEDMFGNPQGQEAMALRALQRRNIQRVATGTIQPENF